MLETCFSSRSRIRVCVMFQSWSGTFSLLCGAVVWFHTLGGVASKFRIGGGLQNKNIRKHEPDTNVPGNSCALSRTFILEGAHPEKGCFLAPRHNTHPRLNTPHINYPCHSLRGIVSLSHALGTGGADYLEVRVEPSPGHGSLPFGEI